VPVNHNYAPPWVFAHVRILKGLQARNLEVCILKGLRADNFGQNRAKRGIGLEVRILRELAVASRRGGRTRFMAEHSMEEFICQ